jgi:molybdenum cofactor guanylyltransferase
VTSRGSAASSEVTVVVLAGGTSRRFGSDKLAAPLAGTTVLDVLLGSLPAQWPLVVVGSERPVVREVRWVGEDPPGAPDDLPGRE